MNILFLSCDSLEGFIVDEEILIKQLESEGHTVSTLSWSKDADWSKFDCAIIRTTWDYMERPQAFFDKLALISSQTKLYNSLDTVKWNIHKGYLKRFEEHGVNIVPTVFFKYEDELNIPANWTEKIVIKPAISAGSYKTLVQNKNQIDRSEMVPGDWMCQPFLPQIFEGEISLIYFNKVFSHALLKVPKKGDFRVQEEFGGDIIPMKPTPELLTLGEKVMKSVSDDLLYARVDLVPYENHYALMELELIEPALYFRTNADAAKNFSKALKDVQR